MKVNDIDWWYLVSGLSWIVLSFYTDCNYIDYVSLDVRRSDDICSNPGFTLQQRLTERVRASRSMYWYKDHLSYRFKLRN